MIGLFLNAVVSLTLSVSMPTWPVDEEIIQHTEKLSAHLPIPMQVRTQSVVQSDSTKKQPFRPQTKPVQSVKQASETRYSAPGHYTVTVPRDNTPGGKADLILVNGTRPIDRISDIDSNTIESIELLKDSKSIARYKLLYGEKAAKGIVIIHLKGTKTL